MRLRRHPTPAHGRAALDQAGQAFRQAGDWARAGEAHRQALQLAEATFGPGLEVAVAAQNLAVTYKYVGRFDEADELYRRALTLAEAGGDDALVATICHNLGGLAHARGAAAEGIAWAERGLAVRTGLRDDLGLAADRGALAGLLIELDRLDEAATLLAEARATFVAHGDRLEVAIVDGNLATIALGRGRLPDAERHARRALAGKEAVLGRNTPDLAVTLTTLGAIRCQQGAVAEAVRLHRRALGLLRPAVAAGHPLLGTIEDNLAEASRPRRGNGRR